MKTLIILAVLMSTAAFAGDKPFMEFGDIKGESTAQAADVIDNAEESAEVQSVTVTNTGEETAKQANASVTDGGIEHEDDWMSPERGQSPSIRNMKRQDRKEVVDGKTNRKAQDYNSSRSNHNTTRSNRDAASGLPTGKRQHKPMRALDPDDDGDSVPTRVCNAKDNDCNDTEDTKSTKD